jgi:hypothetical protein
MTAWPQSSQAATWPPSSAVRQASMAAIALSWPRLRCPALAARQAAPWVRKMSATSSAGRAASEGVYASRSLRLSISESWSKGLITLRIVFVATRV